MTRFKFRAWDGKKLHLPEHSDEQDFFITPEGDIRYIHEVGVVGHKTDSARRGWVLQQFTGLRDKNGKDIYEGDLLRTPSDGGEWDETNYALHEVYFHDGDMAGYNIGFLLGRTRFFGSVCGGTLPYFRPHSTRNLVVVGNIYENQKIINGKKVNGV